MRRNIKNMSDNSKNAKKRKTYFKNKLEIAKNDTKAFWRWLNQVRGKSKFGTTHIKELLLLDNNLVTDTQIAEYMNKYHINIANRFGAKKV